MTFFININEEKKRRILIKTLQCLGIKASLAKLIGRNAQKIKIE